MLILMFTTLTVVSAQVSQPDVIVTPKLTVKNVGEEFRVGCNFPGVDTLQMVNFYQVKWLKGNTTLSSLSLIQVEDIRMSVALETPTDNPRNLTAFLTINSTSFLCQSTRESVCFNRLKDETKINFPPIHVFRRKQLKYIRTMPKTRIYLQYSDVGTYRCKVKDREDTAELKIRRPIQSMRFYLDDAKGASEIAYDGPGSITQSNFETMGRFRPICIARGAYPDPTVDIYYDAEKVRGDATVGSMEKSVIGQAIDFSFKDDKSVLICSASVPGLDSAPRIDLTFNMNFPTYNPVFRCDNSSAPLGKEQHVIECNVSNVNNLACSKIMWEKMDTGDKFQSGNTGKVSVTCFKQNQNSATTRLILDKVTNAHFKAEWAIQYEFEQGIGSNRHIFTIIQTVNAARSVFASSNIFLMTMFVILWK